MAHIKKIKENKLSKGGRCHELCPTKFKIITLITWAPTLLINVFAQLQFKQNPLKKNQK
jgi:hypothetical protein